MDSSFIEANLKISRRVEVSDEGGRRWAVIVCRPGSYPRTTTPPIQVDFFVTLIDWMVRTVRRRPRWEVAAGEQMEGGSGIRFVPLRFCHTLGSAKRMAADLAMRIQTSENGSLVTEPEPN